jgi:hypothetical protein
MINGYVTNLATQMGITISNMSLRKYLATIFILSLESNGSVVDEFVHQSELDGLQKGSCNESLELKVRVALVKLKRNLVH